ncbi:MAG: fructosamine kinase family protein [Gammaproteobacteria bacterium]|nr:fructosamine kinase family protein [Gammaproteobacteria bacterium]NNL49874.1 fructosamine kinase family protein [Woeseiaceae bacterium]
MPDWSSISEHLRSAGLALDKPLAPRPVGGGDISAAWRLDTRNGDVFLKTGPLSASDMFAAEAAGLAEIAASNAVRVPDLLATGQSGDAAFLALEWLDLDKPGSNTERLFGEQLATLHRTVKDRFGWHRDNTVGLTPQHNRWSVDWVDFFREHRLGYQLELAARNGFAGELQRKGMQLMKRMPLFFESYDPVPSLLHGDLWGGNWASSGGEPVLFDPAVYFGDRETDIAMTRLFGGFGGAFYDAYQTAWPLAPGSHDRQQLYQLYHILNHLNLFGSGYLGRALALTKALL